MRSAEDLLLTPAREAGSTRCQKCVGCITLNSVGPCCVCPDCVRKEECTEHTRLCMTWRQPTTTYVAGSEVTGVSSICAIAEYDLKRYRDLVDALGDASLEVEAVLDDFPAGAEQHRNDRYNATRRTRDIQYEEEQFLVIEELVGRYQEERVRLVDVQSDDEEDLDDAVDVGSLPQGQDQTAGIELGALTDTQTHFITPFLPSDAVVRLEPPEEVDDDLGLGLGSQGLTGEELAGQMLEYPLETSALDAGGGETDGEQTVRSLPPPVVAVVQKRTEEVPAAGGPDAKTPTSAATPKVPLPGSQPRTTPESSMDDAVSPPRKDPVQVPLTTLVSLSTTTVTTSSPGATPAPSTSADAVASVSSLGLSGRRRSSSEGIQSVGAASKTQDSDQLFRARQLVTSRSRNLAQNLDTMLTRARNTEEGEIRWIQEEITRCQRDLDRLEDLESTTWAAIGRMEGKAAQTKRMDKWRDWFARQTEKIRQAKSISWDASQRRPSPGLKQGPEAASDRPDMWRR